jgi:hypothetical protein
VRGTEPEVDALATPLRHDDAVARMRADALFFGCVVPVTAATFECGGGGASRAPPSVLGRTLRRRMPRLTR